MNNIPRAQELRLISCHACGLVLDNSATVPCAHCPRCTAPLHLRKPDSIARCWAFLIAAMILYVPANLLPIMITSKFLDTESSTILSGVMQLWDAGSWDLAIIVFTASIVFPVLKIGALMLLLIAERRGAAGHQRDLTRLYRAIEFIGHWSMLDVFVVGLLVTLVHFGTFAQVEAGSGVIAFGAVVVLTMLASMSFDPRLIWDRAEQDRQRHMHAHD